VIDPRQKNWLVKSYDQNLFPNEELWEIELDQEGNMWFSTQYGLCYFDRNTESISQFAPIDGIRHPVLFNKGLYFSENGEGFLGQINGYLSFYPKQMFNKLPASKLALTSFKITVGEAKEKTNINHLEKIDLRYDQNFFKISFALLAYINPQKITYEYKLEGYDKDWKIHKGEENFAEYTKVPAGTYTFSVRAISHINQEQKETLQLLIDIAPPFWLTWWAFLSYAILCLGIGIGFYQFLLRRRLAQEEVLRLKELNEAKTNLFNNITHELRTPLTIILGSIDRAKRSKKVLGDEDLTLIRETGEQLLTLINQVLDMGKIDAGAMPIFRQWEDLATFMKYMTHSFESLANEKAISLSLKIDPQNSEAYFDKEKVSIIVSNLISNALKFSKYEGEIKVLVEIKAAEDEQPISELKKQSDLVDLLCITIKDNGIGISKEQLSLIFERFHQISPPQDKSTEQKGTGIGLSLTKELVNLLGGNISVKSKLDKGSTFFVELPIKTRKHLPASSLTNHIADKELPLVLLVEDNPSLRAYMSSGLSSHVNLIIEHDGLAGVKRAQEVIPDIIVSDIVMPKMDGLELCEKIREDRRTSHIPLILLTAKTDRKSKLEGLDKGADAYLTKPFDEEEIIIRIQTLVNQRKELRKIYLQQVGLTESQLSNLPLPQPLENGTDNKFLQKVKLIITGQLGNSAFSIKDLAKEIGLSHTQLHRKLVALTGQPPVKLMNGLRLKKAKELLLISDLSISEIAYETGHTDPIYFSKTFKSKYGLSPK
ncbi:MAG: ATP-binding protein, partial [Bacteroidota bacterium]